MFFKHEIIIMIMIMIIKTDIYKIRIVYIKHVGLAKVAVSSVVPLVGVV